MNSNAHTLDRLLRQDLNDPLVACDLIRFCERRDLQHALTATVTDMRTISRLAWLANTHWPILFHYQSYNNHYKSLQDARILAAENWFFDLRDANILPYTLALEEAPSTHSVHHNLPSKPIEPSDVLSVLDGLSRRMTPKIWGNITITPLTPPSPLLRPDDHASTIKLSFPPLAIFIALALIFPDPPQPVIDSLKLRSIKGHTLTPFTELLSLAQDLSFLTQMAPALMCARLTCLRWGSYRAQINALFKSETPMSLAVPWPSITPPITQPMPDLLSPDDPFWYQTALMFLGQDGVSING